MKRVTLILLTGITLHFAAPAFGSGSYVARPPQPPAEESSFNRPKYSLGQRLFNGRLKPDALMEADPQRVRLVVLQDLLPDRVSRKRDLPALAGKLTPEQLEALEYYVLRRFKK